MSAYTLPDDGGWMLAAAVIEHGQQNVLLYGPPGTGKSTFACRHGVTEWYRINCHEEMSEAEFLGGMALAESSGATVTHWEDGLGLRAWSTGARLVIDEVDKASGAAKSALYAIADDASTAAYTIPSTGATRRPAPGFAIVATTNTDPAEWEGTELEGLLDRFPVRILIDRPHPDAIAALPEDLRLAAAESCRATDDRRASLRTWRAFASLRHHSGDEHLAAIATFGKARGPEIADALQIARAGGDFADLVEQFTGNPGDDRDDDYR